MIGILKAIGAANWSIRKIFIWVALWIMGMALLIGNALGLGLSLFQQQTGLLKLDESSYYLSEVPIEFNLINILAVNIITILVTLLFMLVPSYLVTRVRIIKILRFD